MHLFCGTRGFPLDLTQLMAEERGSIVDVKGFDAAIDEARERSSSTQTKARPLFKDRRKFSQMVDPLLQGQYPARGLYQALVAAAMCVQEQPNMRPLMADFVTALTYLGSQK